MRNKSSLMTRIILAASFVVAAALGAFSVYIDSLQHQLLTKQIEAQISSTGQQAAHSIANWLNARLSLVEMTANASVNAPDQKAVQNVLTNDVLVQEFTNTFVGTENGGFTLWPIRAIPPGFDPRQRPWYQAAVAANGEILTEPFIDAGSGKLNISAAFPMKRDGRLVGVTAANISPDALEKMISAVDVGTQGFAFLVNRNGQILIHSDARFLTKTLNDLFPISTPNIKASMVETEHDGKPMLVSFVPVKGLPSVDWYLGIAVDADIAYAPIRQFRTAASIATFLSVASMIVCLVIILSRLVVRPITHMTAAMTTIADGNLAVAIPGENRTDQIGSMAAAVAIFRNSVADRVRLEEESEAGRSLLEKERRERDARVAREGAEIQHVVDALETGLDRLATGDLVYRIDSPFAGNLDRLRTNFNNSLAKVQETLASVGTSARGIEIGASEVGSAADNLARRTEQQAASVEQTAAALEEITTTVRDSARRAEEVGALVARTRTGAEKSGEVVNDAIDAMRKIAKSSGDISSIIGVIEDIAFQTNLLALNAGVEAARAGEAGKGFAVVAQEVRELAQRSSEAAKEIKAIITTSGDEVETGVHLVGNAGTALATIVAEVQQISVHINAIVTATREQSTGLQEINTAVNAMDQGTQSNAAMVEEQTAASHSLAQEASALMTLLAQFNLGDRTGAVSSSLWDASRVA